ncbi:MAG: nitroreductase family protein, partial [Actinomycetota bacterium]|nr:nitroreductase family protein [Actinomycetota bacterium]
IMLAARSRGLGGVMTTAICRREPDVARVMGMPDEYGLASLVALGWPKRLPGSLRRAPVERFTTVDTFAGEEFNP